MEHHVKPTVQGATLLVPLVLAKLLEFRNEVGKWSWVDCFGIHGSCNMGETTVLSTSDTEIDPVRMHSARGKTLWLKVGG